jgi:hypothetical protein
MSESGERRALSAFFKTVDGGYVYRAPSAAVAAVALSR